MKRWLGLGLLTAYLWGASLGSSVAQGLAPVYSSLAYQLGAVSVLVKMIQQIVPGYPICA